MSEEKLLASALRKMLRPGLNVQDLRFEVRGTEYRQLWLEGAWTDAAYGEFTVDEMDAVRRAMREASSDD